MSKILRQNTTNNIWKILKFYDKFLKPNETKRLIGFLPQGTIRGVSDGSSAGRYTGGSYDAQLNRGVIDGNYNSEIIFKSAAPKDDIATKRLMMEMVNTGVISRTTAYEEMGILSPQDELDLVAQEQSNPAFNPDGLSKVMSAVNQGQPQPTQAGVQGGSSPNIL